MRWLRQKIQYLQGYNIFPCALRRRRFVLNDPRLSRPWLSKKSTFCQDLVRCWMCSNQYLQECQEDAWTLKDPACLQKSTFFREPYDVLLCS